jgi:hypothetical protein
MTSNPVIVVTDIIFATFWLVAYVGIIYRGYKDKTYGMPVAALVVNISWEAAYAFFVDPFSNHVHLLTIPWFIFDVVIFWQTLKYGAKEFVDIPFVRRNFTLILIGAVAIAFPPIYWSFYEFRDPEAIYNGFAANTVMSILFIAMLLRRDSPRGQSIYIAIAKFLGTLFAWLATALTVTTSPTNEWPESFTSFWVDSITHTEYPLTPLVNYLYLVIFFLDIAYIILLYRRLKADQINPWRRF